TDPRNGSRRDCLPVCGLRRAVGRAIVGVMRRIAIALVLVSAAACSKKKAADKPQPDKGSTGSGSAGSDKQVAPKEPPPPLPGLGKDPGGATGDPMWVVGFGGLATDTVRGL